MKRIFAVAIAAILAVTGVMAGSPLDFLGSLVQNATQSSKFEIASLEGAWKYQSPAISFKSDNALNQIGGLAATSTVEGKLAPYYKRLGIDKAQITFDKDGNFTIKLKGGVKLVGVATKDDDTGLMTFNFTPNGQFSLGRISARAQMSANGQLSLTFDASRTIGVVQKIAQFSQNATLNTLSTLLGSYEGVYAGAKLKKSK